MRQAKLVSFFGGKKNEEECESISSSGEIVQICVAA